LVRTLALALEELALHGLEVVEVPVELLLGTPLHLAALVLVLTLTSLNLSSLNNIASLVVGVVSLALVVMLLLSALVVAAATAILVISASTLVVVVSVAAASVSAELVVVVASATTAAGCHWLASLSAAPLIFRNGLQKGKGMKNLGLGVLTSVGDLNSASPCAKWQVSAIWQFPLLSK